MKAKMKPAIINYSLRDADMGMSAGKGYGNHERFCDVCVCLFK